MTVPEIIRRPSREEELKARARSKGLARATKAFGGYVRSGQTAQQRNVLAARVGVQVNRAIALIQAEQKAKGITMGREAAAGELRKRARAIALKKKLPSWAKGQDRLGKTIKGILTYSPRD